MVPWYYVRDRRKGVDMLDFFTYTGARPDVDFQESPLNVSLDLTKKAVEARNEWEAILLDEWDAQSVSVEIRGKLPVIIVHIGVDERPHSINVPWYIQDGFRIMVEP